MITYSEIQKARRFGEIAIVRFVNTRRRNIPFQKNFMNDQEMEQFIKEAADNGITAEILWHE